MPSRGQESQGSSDAKALEDTSVMKCTNCNSEIADKALICYRCGKATTAPRITPPAERSLFERPRKSRWPLVVVVIVIIALVILAWLFSGRLSASTSTGLLLHPFGNALQGIADPAVLRLFDGEVSERHDADKTIVLDDRQTADLVLTHEIRRFPGGRVG